MNDIVEVAGHYGKTPLIRFIQKGKGVVSFTGEKLYETQVIAAVDQAFAALRGRYHFIAAVAELVDGTSPRLVFLTEFDHPVTDPDGSALVDQVDAALGDQNSEYQTKRKSLRYGAPIIRVVRPGEFDRYRRRMVEQGHRTDGQFKVLRLTSDTSFAAEFQAERDLVGGAVPQLVPEQVPRPGNDVFNRLAGVATHDGAGAHHEGNRPRPLRRTEVLKFADIDQPVPTDDEVLVQVRAAGVHRGDWHVMTGLPYLTRLVVPTLGLRRPKVPAGHGRRRDRRGSRQGRDPVPAR